MRQTSPCAAVILGFPPKCCIITHRVNFWRNQTKTKTGQCNPTVTAFELGWATWLVSLQEETWSQRDTPGVHVCRGKAVWRGSKGSHQQAKREASEEIKPASTFILDFQPPERWENKLVFCCSVCGICYSSPGKLTQCDLTPVIQLLWTN